MVFIFFEKNCSGRRPWVYSRWGGLANAVVFIFRIAAFGNHAAKMGGWMVEECCNMGRRMLLMVEKWGNMGGKMWLGSLLDKSYLPGVPKVELDLEAQAVKTDSVEHTRSAGIFQFFEKGVSVVGRVT